MNEKIKDYYARELNTIETPPFPTMAVEKRLRGKNMIRRYGDNILMAAAIAASLIMIIHPLSYKSKVRGIYTSKEQVERLKELVPRTLYETSIYFKEIKESQS